MSAEEGFREYTQYILMVSEDCRYDYSLRSQSLTSGLTKPQIGTQIGNGSIWCPDGCFILTNRV